jgi:S-(hydroxymethyl)glutathione dehydrogenase/alcohol dehydrogenase
VIVGVAPAGTEISTRPFQLVTGRRWIGTAFGGYKVVLLVFSANFLLFVCSLALCFVVFHFISVQGRSELPGLVESYMSGKLRVDEYITGTFELEKINDAFHELHTGRAIRSIIKVNK